MAYYKHESFPWPRGPVKDENSFSTYERNHSSFQNSSVNPYANWQSSQYAQSSNQMSQTQSAGETAEDILQKSLLDHKDISGQVETNKAGSSQPDNADDQPYTGGPLSKQQRKHKTIFDSVPHSFIMTSLHAIANFLEDDTRTTFLFIKLDPSRARFLHTVNWFPFKRSLYSLLGVDCETLMQRLRGGCNVTQLRVAEGAVRKKDKCRDVSIKKKLPKAPKNRSGQMQHEEVGFQNPSQSKLISVPKADENDYPEIPAKKIKIKPTKSMIRIETLDELLSFVKDNKKVQLKLKYQRNFLRGIVKSVTNNNPKWIFKSGCCNEELTKWMSVFRTICYHNEYELLTKLEMNPNKQIIAFKVPPAHVYLINKDDLKEMVDDDDHSDKVIAGNGNITTRDCESNKFLNALMMKQEPPNCMEEDLTNTEIKLDLIKLENVEVKKESTNDYKTQNAKVSTGTEVKIENVAVKQENTDDAKTEIRKMKRELYIRALLKKYLKEFFENSVVTEMRFLGAFDEIEQKVLDDFVLKLHQHLCRIESKNDWLYDTIFGKRYAIDFDSNGSEKIVKTQ